MPMKASIKSVLGNIVKGTCPTVIVESTVYPGFQLGYSKIATELSLEEDSILIYYCPEEFSGAPIRISRNDGV